jgi:hypothetical protein
MKTKVIMEKGYTLSVTSWENDADNYNTKRKTYQSKEQALEIQKMCEKLFVSCNNGDGGIGNTNDGEIQTARMTIVAYLIENPAIFDALKIPGLRPIDMQDKVIQEFKDEPDFKADKWADWLSDYIEVNNIDDKWSNYVMEENWDLMGGSEWYYSRVYESSEIFYCESDLKCEVL